MKERFYTKRGETLTSKYQGYNPDFLLDELKRFYLDNNRIPMSVDLDYKGCGYPSRKTYAKYFGSLDSALRLVGLLTEDKKNYEDKKFLISELHRYTETFGKQPFSREMDSNSDFPCKYHYVKAFGSWNNAIKEANLKPRVSKYTDKELRQHFFHFVETNGRPPKLHEFNNNTDYPSFWCYQNRFGSWNKAFLHYGFEPYEGACGKLNFFDNGELCRSVFEYDLSKWLRKNNISYLRNVPYQDFIETYQGRKDCDYVIIHNGEWIWLEIAGFYSKREKKSSLEKRYIKNFEHKKEQLLSEFNYVIIEGHEMEDKPIDELMSFLWDIPYCPYSNSEPIYQGLFTNEEMEEYVEWLKL